LNDVQLTGDSLAPTSSPEFKKEMSMKAAVVTAAGKTPIYGDFETPTAQAGEELISVRASALSNLSRSRASGTHYTSAGSFPLVAGSDGVGRTQDGRRVYFAMPEAPFGALAEFCPVSARRCVELPNSLDDITAAAIANPGMSAWAALVERAHLVAGETVLVNGATGTAGRLAVRLAKHLGAGKVIATGRNAEELEEVKQLGADVVIPFTLGMLHPSGAKDYENALQQVFASGIHVVVDYLWGESAKTVIVAIAKAVDDGTPVRFVHVGGASGEQNIELPGAALRSSAIMLMGSGAKSVPLPVLLQSIRSIFEVVQTAGLKIATNVVPLSEIESVWDKAPGKPRLVFSIG
jgi:NADPH:quinone reductase-like Zn-dependent oxidoreductase